jgi:hypothetical protein
LTDGTSRRIPANGHPSERGGPGRAKCSCQKLSPVLPSKSACKAWHRGHKVNEAEKLGRPTPPPYRRLAGPARCPACSTPQLSWAVVALLAPGSPSDGTLRAHDMRVVAVLGCDECTETVEAMADDDIDALLNRRRRQP